MIYQGQDVEITLLRNKDSVALVRAIQSIDQEIIDIQYSAVQELDYNIYYTALVITKAE